METVSQEVVETARREVEGLTPETALSVMTRIREAQPDVLGFVLSETRDLPRPVVEVANFLAVTLLVIFEKAAGAAIPRVSREDLLRAYEENAVFLRATRIYTTGKGTITPEEAKAGGRAAETFDRQPYVLNFLFESLARFSEGDLGHLEKPEDMSLLFVLLKTAVDVLDRAFDEAAAGDTEA